MEEDKYIVEWNADEAPDWPRINHALANIGHARIIPVRTGDDAYLQAVIVATPQTTFREAQVFYDEHQFDGVESTD